MLLQKKTTTKNPTKKKKKSKKKPTKKFVMYAKAKSQPVEIPSFIAMEKAVKKVSINDVMVFQAYPKESGCVIAVLLRHH